jgi:hypothetical protein
MKPHELYLEKVIDKKIAYHVTPTKNIEKIKSTGLIPSKNKETGDFGIFMFETTEALEDAMMNWLGDKFDENEDLSLLTLDITGLKYNHGAGYEILTTEKISPDRIKKIKNI